MTHCHVVSAEDSGPHHLVSGLQTEKGAPPYGSLPRPRVGERASWNAVSSKCCSHVIVQIKAGTQNKRVWGL